MNGNQVKRVEGPIFWIAMALLVALSMGNYYLARGGDRTLFCVGIWLTVLPVAIASPGIYALRKYGKAGIGKDVAEPIHLVRENVYALVRHPQYLGLMIMAAGFMAIYQHPITTAIGFFSMLFFYFQTEREEEYCLDVFGEDFRLYSTDVPKFNIIAGIWRRMHQPTT